MKFTDLTVKNLKPKECRYTVFEDNSYGHGTLGLRVTPRGSKSWVHFYKIDGRKRMTTLGQYPRMSVAQAHAAFSQAALSVISGGDPASGKVAENERRRLAPRVRDLAALYIEKWAKVRKRSWKRDERMLEREVLPQIGHMRVEDVRRRHVIAVLDVLVDRGAPVQANRMLALVRKMFNFAVSRDLIEHSPCQQIAAPSPERSRDRVLSYTELEVLLENLPKVEMWTPTQLALLLLLTTAQRPGEVVGATWSEVDLAERVWTIPGERTKNRLEHRVPLSDQALAVLDVVRLQATGSGAVFPSRRTGGVMVHSLLSRAIGRERAKLGVDHFTPHDLRRSAASHMTALQVPRLTVSKVLNHKEGGVTTVYDRYSYEAEKREALSAWADELSRFGLHQTIAELRGRVEWRVSGRWWKHR